MLDKHQELESNILKGQWELVFTKIHGIKIPKHKLINLYEHVIFEFVESNEIGAARSLLRETQIMFDCKNEDEARYLFIEEVLSKASAKHVFSVKPRDTRRLELCNEIMKELLVAQEGTLISLINDGLCYRQANENIPLNCDYDLLRGVALGMSATVDQVPTQMFSSFALEDNSSVQSCIFSRDGSFLATGSSDGFIELWNYFSGSLLEREVMVMEHSVLALAISHNLEYLASGSIDGSIFVWKISTGACVKKFISAHAKGVCHISFSLDDWEILSCGHDNLIKISGLRSGKQIKEFNGHSSFINHAIYSVDGNRIISSSSDGTIKFWDAKSGGCLFTLDPKQFTKQEVSYSIISTMAVPKSAEKYIVTTNSATLVLHSSGKVFLT